MNSATPRLGCSVADLAALYGWSVNTIRDWCAQSPPLIPHYRLPGNRIWFDLADVAAWVEARKVAAAPGDTASNPLTRFGLTPMPAARTPRGGARRSGKRRAS